jgi:large subunit ribosomal protein L5
MNRLKELYKNEIVDQLMDSLAYENVMEVPRLEKIVVNIGVGDALENIKTLDDAVRDLATITGQQPVITKSRKNIANFKLRAGAPIGTRVTLRGERMWSFLDRLVNVALPRVRDFRGVSPNSFDGRGNYSLGLREQLVFPEIDYDQVNYVRGLGINIITTTEDDEAGRELLRLLGMPFKEVQ